MLVEVERHENCTVIVSRDTKTGKLDIAWYDNDNPPIQLIKMERE